MLPAQYRIRMTLDVLADLEEIHRYISQDSPQAAAEMIERLLDAIDSLEQFPHRKVVERQTPQLKSPVRSLVVKPYIIYYRVIDVDKIVVIRHIRHGARQQPSRFD